MIGMSLNRRALDVLCLGAHPDDIEIGCGGALLRLARRDGLTLSGVVLTGDEDRADEARAALDRFVPGSKVETFGLPDGRLPAHWEQTKQALEDVATRRRPDLVFAPRIDDAHQDHRLVGSLATHGLARRPGAALRDPEVGRRHGLTDALRRPDRRGRAPQGRAAQRELPEPDRPRLVGRRDVPGPPAYQGHGVAAPVCGGVLRVEGAPGPGRAARRCHEDGRVARTGVSGQRGRFARSVAAQDRLHDLVPGGAHTYARGADQYPEGMAPVIVRGHGARVEDLDGNTYVEYGMGLRAVTLGHGYEPVHRGREPRDPRRRQLQPPDPAGAAAPPNVRRRRSPAPTW